MVSKSQSIVRENSTTTPKMMFANTKNRREGQETYFYKQRMQREIVEREDDDDLVDADSNDSLQRFAPLPLLLVLGTPEGD